MTASALNELQRRRANIRQTSDDIVVARDQTRIDSKWPKWDPRARARARVLETVYTLYRTELQRLRNVLQASFIATIDIYNRINEASNVITAPKTKFKLPR